MGMRMGREKRALSMKNKSSEPGSMIGGNRLKRSADADTSRFIGMLCDQFVSVGVLEHDDVGCFP